jgi:aminoglycoside phosphotransferase (APT) family kinase protein
VRYSRHAWLAAALPASAECFRVSDPELAATLAAAGGKLVNGAPDVEIVSSADFGGEAPCVIVAVDHGPKSGCRRDALPLRSARRIAASAAAQVDCRRARWRLERAGFRTSSFVWDLEQVLRPAGEPTGHLRLVEHFPRAAVVIGTRGERMQTTLDAAVEAASTGAGGSWGVPLVRESGLVATSDRGVLRVAVGPGTGALDGQMRALAQLRAQPLPPIVAERVPDVLAEGSTGLARWTLEQRLPGRPPSYPLGPRVLAWCTDFLVALQTVGESGGSDLTSQATAAADACPREEADAIHRLARRLAPSVRELRRGFGHGDFWAGNLLVEGNTLTGVIDWENAGAARLPLLDLLHLELNAERPTMPERWGPAILERLLPSARAGGSHLVREYCERVGLAATPELLVDLVFAYWLDRLALELTSFVDRRLRKSWMQNNVELILDAARLEGSARRS